MSQLSSYLRLTLASLVMLVLAACEGDTRELVNTVDAAKLKLDGIYFRAFDQRQENATIIPLGSQQPLDTQGYRLVNGGNPATPCEPIGTIPTCEFVPLPSTPIFSSSNSDIVSVTNDGNITALTNGDATISALYGGLRTRIDLSVKELEAITVTANEMPDLCRTYQDLQAIGVFNGGTTQVITNTVTWTTPSNARAENLGNGFAEYAVRNGQPATFTASSLGKDGSLVITGTVNIETVSVSPENPSVNVGNTIQFEAEGTWAGARESITKNIFWEQDGGFAEIDTDTGLATGAREGVATIIARCGSGESAQTDTAQLTVNPRPTVEAIEFYRGPVDEPSSRLVDSIPIDVSPTPFHVSSRIRFSDGSYQDITNRTDWVSADTSIFTVGNDEPASGVLERDEKGALIGVAPSTGGADLDITYKDGGSDTYEINIRITVNGTPSGT